MKSILSSDEQAFSNGKQSQSSGDEYQSPGISSNIVSFIEPRRTNKQPVYKDDSDYSSQMFENSGNSSENEDDFQKKKARRPPKANSAKNQKNVKKQKRKQRRFKRSAQSMDSDAEEDDNNPFEEDIPENFGDTTSSSNEAEPSLAQDQSNNSQSENEEDVSNPAKQIKEYHIIQEIIGIRESQDHGENEEEEDYNSLYYVKWNGLSFIHCSYLTKEQIEAIPGGAAALKKYLAKINRGYGSLSQSLSIPSLLTIDDNLVSANYFEVDRIIGKRTYVYENDELNHINIIDNPFKDVDNFTNIPPFLYNDNIRRENEGKIQYYVKWRSLGYDESTWEFQEDIQNIPAITQYEERHSYVDQNPLNTSKYIVINGKEYLRQLKCWNSTKISDNRRCVDPRSFVELDDPLSDSEGNTLRDYQVKGFNWLRFCWYNGINSILADEMGLGKTLQVVSTLNDIYTNHNIHGPFLVIAPLSTLPHWKNEFERWTKMNAIIYHGNAKSREIIRKYEMFDYVENGSVGQPTNAPGQPPFQPNQPSQQFQQNIPPNSFPATYPPNAAFQPNQAYPPNPALQQNQAYPYQQNAYQQPSGYPQNSFQQYGGFQTPQNGSFQSFSTDTEFGQVENDTTSEVSKATSDDNDAKSENEEDENDNDDDDFNAIKKSKKKPSKSESVYNFDFDDNLIRDKGHVCFDVLITNYETFMNDYDLFHSIEWHYLVLDEGHRLKNHTGKCYRLLKKIKFEHCTLLTGTPVQNNVEELWSLLHFLDKNKFKDLSTFMKDFGVIENAETLQQLQMKIRPYILRRKKSDVDTSIAAKEETIIEVEMTRVQKSYYRAFLSDNSSTLLSKITGGALPSLLNLMMQLRKVCNHPFLIKGATAHIEEQMAQQLHKPIDDEEVILRSLVDSSGKLILIDKLLPKLREGHHKVLIFSQMVKVLDILEEYLSLIDIKPERIDGSVPENERQNAIERFANDPNAFVFLLCTRAGGVGINLTAADTVIIYDSDWNPQNDIQAESRCHRIGQTSKVKVYRLVTRGTYELEMLDRASKKLGLDHAILDGGSFSSKQSSMAAHEIEKLLRTGVYNLAKDDDEIDKFCAADIDQILERRSKSFTRDVVAGGDSLFSTASFTVDEAGNADSKNFWSEVLPTIKTEEEPLTRERACRSKQLKFNESDDEDTKKSTRRTISGVLSPRGLASRIMHDGYKGTPKEKALILYALTEVPLDEEHTELLKEILGMESLTDKSDEILKAEKKFQPSLEEWTDKKETLMQRVFFFYQLNIVMSYIQQPISFWPKTDTSSSPLVDYALLYGIAKNGLGMQSRVMEGIVYDDVMPVLSDKMIQKVARTIISAFFDDARQIPNLTKKFLEPNDWKAAHHDLFNRKVMNNEEFQSLFQTMTLTGFIEKRRKKPIIKTEEAINNSQNQAEGNQAIEQLEEQTQENENEPNNQQNETHENEQNEMAANETETERNEQQNEGENQQNENENQQNENENNTQEDGQNVEDGVNEELAKIANRIDWASIRKFASLYCVSISAVKEAGIQIIKLVNDYLDKDEQDEVLAKLGQYSNRAWISRMKSTIRDIEKIRVFANQLFGDDEPIDENKLGKSDNEEEDGDGKPEKSPKQKIIERLKKMKYWDQAPSWWDTSYDIALIRAISDYGLIYVTKWLIDPDRPFLQHIPESYTEDFTKAAEQEQMKSRPQRPKEPGEFAFLYTDKTRLQRCNLVIQFTNAQIQKSKRYEADPSYKGSSHIDTSDATIITEIPQLPLEIGSQMTVLDLGHFLSPSDMHPVGYRVNRQYFSLKNPKDKSWYEAFTKVNEEGKFRYVVKHLSEPEMVFEAHTASGVWENVIKEIENVKGRLGMPKRKFNSVSGPLMYGFSNPLICACFKLMKAQADEEEP